VIFGIVSILFGMTALALSFWWQPYVWLYAALGIAVSSWALVYTSNKGISAMGIVLSFLALQIQFLLGQVP